MPSAFFSVSGSAGDPKPESQAEAHHYLETFLTETGWHPSASIVIGGAIAYTKYNPLIRWIVKRMTRRTGGPTDTSRDNEMTDWEKVDRFAAELATQLAQRSEMVELVRT